MLLPALSRSVGVISQNGGYRGNPIPITVDEISETVCIDNPTSYFFQATLAFNIEMIPKPWAEACPSVPLPVRDSAQALRSARGESVAVNASICMGVCLIVCGTFAGSGHYRVRPGS
jgi:hypothetical protein